MGLDPQTTARKLRAADEPYGPAVFWGQKIAGLIVGVVMSPVLESAGIGPTSGWPVRIWAGSALLGFAGPDLGLNARVRARRREMLVGLAAATRLLSLAVSAGYGLEQAVAEVASSGRVLSSTNSRIASTNPSDSPCRGDGFDLGFGD